MNYCSQFLLSLEICLVKFFTTHLLSVFTWCSPSVTEASSICRFIFPLDVRINKRFLQSISGHVGLYFLYGFLQLFWLHLCYSVVEKWTSHPPSFLQCVLIHVTYAVCYTHVIFVYTDSKQDSSLDQISSYTQSHCRVPRHLGGLAAPIAPHFPPPLPLAQSGFFNEDWPRCVWSCCQLSALRPLSLMPIQQSPQPLQLLPPPPWVQYGFKAKTLLGGCLVSKLKMWRRGTI